MVVNHGRLDTTRGLIVVKKWCHFDVSGEFLTELDFEMRQNASSMSLSYYIINHLPLTIITNLVRSKKNSVQILSVRRISAREQRSHAVPMQRFKSTHTESFWCSNTITFRLLCKRKRNSMTLIRDVYIIESYPAMCALGVTRKIRSKSFSKSQNLTVNKSLLMLRSRVA